MLRVGFHYVEPRRLGFFLAEEAAIAVSFVVGSAALARVLSLAAPTVRLASLAMATCVLLAFLLSLADLHDLCVALDGQVAERRLLRVLGVAAVVGALAVFAMRDGPGAAPAGAGLIAASLALVASRVALMRLGRDHALHTRVFLVGEGQSVHRLAREIARHDGTEVVGFAGSGAEDLAGRVAAANASVIAVAADERRGMPIDELLRCRLAGLTVADAGTFCARVLHRLPVDLVRPSDLIYGDGFARSRWVRAGRRALSIGASLALLCFAGPLLVIAALAIKLDSHGPVLFRQTRTGRDGRPFQMLKLRTMHVGAERAGAAWARQGDPRITRVGRVLRRFRVDELPQLFNVLRGEMELVGPRPERPEFVAELRQAIPYYDLRHMVAPGITGWAQICYPYAASVEEAAEKLQYDLYYVRHLGIAFDLFILMLTARTILLGRGAR